MDNIDEQLKQLLEEYAAPAVLLNSIIETAQAALQADTDYNERLEQLFNTVAELMALEGYADNEEETQPQVVRPQLTVVK